MLREECYVYSSNMMAKWAFAHVSSRVKPENNGNQ